MQKLFLVGILVLRNLFIGAWIDRTWFRMQSSAAILAQAPAEPVQMLSPPDVRHTVAAIISPEVKKVEPPAKGGLIRSSTDFRAGADQLLRKPGAFILRRRNQRE